MSSGKPTAQHLHATAAAQLTSVSGTDVEAATTARMLHEPEAHRIELEMQNEVLRQSQAALAESSDRYANLYKFAPVGYLALTEQGRIAEINLAGAASLGVDRTQVIARRFAQFVADEDNSRWHRLFRRALGQSETLSEELLLQRKDGSIFQAKIDCRFATHEVLLTLTDISQHKRIEAQLLASEKRYFALFRDASDAIAIADANGRLEEVNRRFAALLGYREDELRGASIEMLHPADELARIRTHFAEIVSHGSVAALETKIARKDGTLIEVEVRPTPITIGGRRAAQGVFIDLTERKRIEQRRIDEEAAHRSALVREVHHRIKNNLQSVAGLLQRELGKYAELGPPLKTAISQVHAIAVVHGLQSADADESIRLCDSISNICRTVADLSQRPVLFRRENEQTSFRPVRVESSEAVSLALVLNELILNAVKHSPPDSAAPTVSLSADGSSAQLLIRNAFTTAPEFDIDSGRGLGTGLRLVRSLLPRAGAHLAHETDTRGFVLTRLSLTAPVVTQQDEDS